MQVIPGGENKPSVPRSRKERGPSPVVGDENESNVHSDSSAPAEPMQQSSVMDDDWKWCIALFCIGYGTIGAARTAFASVLPDLIMDPASDFNPGNAAAAAAAGTFATLCAKGIVTFTFDNWVYTARRSLLVFGAVVTSAAAVLLVIATTANPSLLVPWLWAADRFIMSFGWPCIAVFVAERVPSTSRGKVWSILSGGTQVGHVVGGFATSTMLQMGFGWRGTLHGMAWIMVAASLPSFWASSQTHPGARQAPTAGKAQQRVVASSSLWTVARTWTFVWLALGVACLSGVNSFAVLLPQFVSDVLGQTPAAAAFLAAWKPLGCVLSQAVGGSLADRLDRTGRGRLMMSYIAILVMSLSCLVWLTHTLPHDVSIPLNDRLLPLSDPSVLLGVILSLLVGFAVSFPLNVPPSMFASEVGGIHNCSAGLSSLVDTIAYSGSAVLMTGIYRPLLKEVPPQWGGVLTVMVGLALLALIAAHGHWSSRAEEDDSGPGEKQGDDVPATDGPDGSKEVKSCTTAG